MIHKQPDPEKKYYTISELSAITGVAPHSIRYWEKEFGLLRPMRKESGHRRYLRRDIEILNEIKDLVYRRKMTLAGAKKALSRRGGAQPDAPAPARAADEETRRLLEEAHKELSAIMKEC
ncbi:MAG: MerR family transcriptional regulator [Elusimicrobiales bacterium]|nr:MerR family transcriptional regulator [Elusimicrobiales bacterium]